MRKSNYSRSRTKPNKTAQRSSFSPSLVQRPDCVSQDSLTTRARERRNFIHDIHDRGEIINDPPGKDDQPGVNKLSRAVDQQSVSLRVEDFRKKDSSISTPRARLWQINYSGRDWLSFFSSQCCDRWEIKNFAVANKFQELCQDSKKTELLINNSRGGFCARGVFFVFAMKMAVIKNDKSLHG